LIAINFKKEEITPELKTKLKKSCRERNNLDWFEKTFRCKAIVEGIYIG
jgi:hypothetical protein